MPYYHYHCKSCDKDWEEMHSISDLPGNCPFCETNNFHRVPAYVTSIKKHQEAQKAKVGEVVKQYIEDNKEVLRDYKQELKKKEL